MAWKLERSAESVAQGIGCSEENDSERVPVARSVQPVFNIEDVVPRGVYPGWLGETTRTGLGVGLYSVVEIFCPSEVRCIVRPDGTCRVTQQRASLITGNLTISAPPNPRTDFVPRTIMRTGSATIAGDGFSVAGAVEKSFIVPSGYHLTIIRGAVNTNVTVGFDAEERDGRVVRTLSQ